MQSFNLATPFEPLRVRATTTQQLERHCDKRNGARSHGDCQWRVIARIGELLSARLGRSLLSGVFRTIAPCLIGCGVSRTTWFCRIPRIRLVGIGRPGLIRVRVAGPGFFFTVSVPGSTVTSKFGSMTVASIWHSPAGELSSATQEYSTFTPEVSTALSRLEVKAGFVSPSKRSVSSTFTVTRLCFRANNVYDKYLSPDNFLLPITTRRPALSLHKKAEQPVRLLRRR